MGSTNKCISCTYVVVELMLKFALGQMKIRHVAAEKIGHGVFTETLKPCNFSSSRNCGPTKIASEILSSSSLLSDRQCQNFSSVL